MWNEAYKLAGLLSFQGSDTIQRLLTLDLEFLLCTFHCRHNILPGWVKVSWKLIVPQSWLVKYLCLLWPLDSWWVSPNCTSSTCQLTDFWLLECVQRCEFLLKWFIGNNQVWLLELNLQRCWCILLTCSQVPLSSVVSVCLTWWPLCLMLCVLFSSLLKRRKSSVKSRS